jgi:hypothetical protein
MEIVYGMFILSERLVFHLKVIPTNIDCCLFARNLPPLVIRFSARFIDDNLVVRRCNAMLLSYISAVICKLDLRTMSFGPALVEYDTRLHQQICNTCKYSDCFLNMRAYVKRIDQAKISWQLI